MGIGPFRGVRGPFVGSVEGFYMGNSRVPAGLGPESHYLILGLGYSASKTITVVAIALVFSFFGLPGLINRNGEEVCSSMYSKVPKLIKHTEAGQPLTSIFCNPLPEL